MKATYYSSGYIGTSKSPLHTYPYAAAVSCKNCHHISSVSWESDGQDGIPTKALKKIKICPKCGKPNTFNSNTSVITERSSNNSAVILLEEMLNQKDETAIRKKIDSIISKSFSGKDMSADNTKALTVINSCDILKQYLLHVLNAEAAVYFLSERILSIKKAQLQNTRESEYEKAAKINADEKKKTQQSGPKKN